MIKVYIAKVIIIGFCFKESKDEHLCASKKIDEIDQERPQNEININTNKQKKSHLSIKNFKDLSETQKDFSIVKDSIFGSC